jgi:hypothetical protein
MKRGAEGRVYKPPLSLLPSYFITHHKVCFTRMLARSTSWLGALGVSSRCQSEIMMRCVVPKSNTRHNMSVSLAVVSETLSK